MKICPNFKKIAVRHTSSNEPQSYRLLERSMYVTRVFRHGTVEVVRVRCKQWSCPFCANLNGDIWRSHLSNALPKVSQNWVMITFTASSQTREQHKSYANLQRGFDRIIKRMRRIYAKLEYVRVYEKHPTSDALHIHCLVANTSERVERYKAKNGRVMFRVARDSVARKGSWSIQTWCKVAAWGCGMGYQVKVDAVEVSRAARYVTKYLTKNQQDIRVKHLRHVALSSGIPRIKKPAKSAWDVQNALYLPDVRRGEAIIDLNLREQVPLVALQIGIKYPNENTEAD